MGHTVVTTNSKGSRLRIVDCDSSQTKAGSVGLDKGRGSFINIATSHRKAAVVQGLEGGTVRQGYWKRGGIDVGALEG